MGKLEVPIFTVSSKALPHSTMQLLIGQRTKSHISQKSEDISMTNRHLEGFPTSLDVREMDINTV